MKFLLDQSTDARLGTYLRKLGHDVTRVATDYPAGLLDPKILSLARAEGRILITDDRDFGEWVFRFKLPHAGVIFLRLGTYAPLDLKIERLAYVLTHYADHLDQFLVVIIGNVCSSPQILDTRLSEVMMTKRRVTAW
jgi:predicted nuclease of predicted toxin-antitoxin system